MSDIPGPPTVITGHCMCRAVTYESSGKLLGVGICHCDLCRPQAGSAFSTVAVVSRRELVFTGTTAVFAHIGASGSKVLRRYCPACGAPLATESEGTPDISFLKTGGFDQGDWLQPQLEMFVTRRLRWVAPIPGIPQFEGNPSF